MTLADYAEHRAKSRPVIWIDGIPWEQSRRRLIPLAMPHKIKPIVQEKVLGAMRRTGAQVAVWNDTWDTPECSWWWICCDTKSYDVEGLPKKARRDIRAGLRRCEVRRVESEWFAENGYDVYASAYAGYGVSAPIESSEQFAEEFRRNGEYSGRETWGAFVNEALVAYASCIVVDDAVLLSSAKSCPEYRKSLPNNGLMYVLTRHYLQERDLRYVTDGTRSISHDTSFQNFLENMGYRRIYCPARLLLGTAAKALVASRVGSWGRCFALERIRPGILEKVQTLTSLATIARECEQMPPSCPGDGE